MNTNEEIEIIEEVNNKNNIQVLKETVKINSLIGSGNTKIHGKETIQIDATDNLAEIIKANINLVDKDIKISYNKIKMITLEKVNN